MRSRLPHTMLQKPVGNMASEALRVLNLPAPHTATIGRIPDRQPGWIASALVIIATLAFVLGIAGYVSNIPRLYGMALALTGLLLHYWAYQCAARWSPGEFGPRFMVFGSAFPSVGLFFTYLVSSGVSIGSFPLDLISTQPITALIGWMAIPIGVLGYAFLRSVFGRENRLDNKETLVGLFDRMPRSMETMLIAGCAITFLSWFVTRDDDGSGLGTYLIRILMRVCTFIPFAVGYYWDKFRLALVVCAATFAIGLYFAFLTGSRGYVYLPLMLFFIGVLTRQVVKRKLLQSLTLLTPLALVLIGFGGVIGIMRDEVGRSHVGAEGEASVTQRRAIARDALQSGGTGTGNFSVIENIAFRLVPWPNLTVPVMSPEEVPYRGFGDIKEELKAMLHIARFTGVFYFTNLHSNEYGFYTGETSSVEFGIIADAWSRGGLLVALIYGAIGAWLLAVLERGLRHLAGAYLIWHPIIVLLIFSVAWFDYGRTGLVYSYRGAIISAVILGGLIMTHRFVSKKA